MMSPTRRAVLRAAFGGALATTGLRATSGRAAGARHRFQVIMHGESGERRIGAVEVDDAAMLTVVSAIPDRAQWLRKLVRRMNDKQVLYIDAPPADGQPRFALASREVPRNDPRFAAVLRDDLRRNYDLELR
jgi:hypothetical protein